MELAIILPFVIGVVWWAYDFFVKKVPIQQFGVENVQRIAKWESPEWRERVFSQGLTHAEWVRINRRQIKAITDELKRRGLE